MQFFFNEFYKIALSYVSVMILIGGKGFRVSDLNLVKQAFDTHKIYIM